MRECEDCGDYCSRECYEQGESVSNHFQENKPKSTCGKEERRIIKCYIRRLSYVKRTLIALAESPILDTIMNFINHVIAFTKLQYRLLRAGKKHFIYVMIV